MAPRTYNSDKVAPIRSIAHATPKQRSTVLHNLPLEAWEDNQFWHSAKQAAGILQERCGKSGFSYESLLDGLENEYIEGFHWFKRGGVYKLNIWRMIKYPPGSLET